MSDPPPPALAARIDAASRLHGRFQLRSGATSDTYFDKYRFESDPALLRAIADGMAGLLPADVELLAGLELGGIPVATVLSAVTGIPAVFVRKQAKTYGTCQLAEGADVDGQRVVIVEDVVTSAGQVVASAGDLRALGASVEVAVCVVDRQSGGAERLAVEGIALRALLTASELDAARDGGSAGRPLVRRSGGTGLDSS